MRLLVWHPKAREAVRSFPEEVKDIIGQALLDLQRGLSLAMPKARHMPSVGMGVEELRVKGKDGIYRVFYLKKDERGILVFHAFMKKTQKTSPLEIQLARKRLKEL